MIRIQELQSICRCPGNRNIPGSNYIEFGSTRGILMLSISLWSCWVVVFLNAHSLKAGCRGCQFREREQHGPPKPCTEELTWPRPQLHATAPTVTAAMTSKQVARFVFEILVLGRSRGHINRTYGSGERKAASWEQSLELLSSRSPKSFKWAPASPLLLLYKASSPTVPHPRPGQDGVFVDLAAGLVH